MILRRNMINSRVSKDLSCDLCPYRCVNDIARDAPTPLLLPFYSDLASASSLMAFEWCLPKSLSHHRHVSSLTEVPLVSRRSRRDLNRWLWHDWARVFSFWYRMSFCIGNHNRALIIRTEVKVRQWLQLITYIPTSIYDSKDKIHWYGIELIYSQLTPFLQNIRIVTFNATRLSYISVYTRCKCTWMSVIKHPLYHLSGFECRFL